ELSESSEAPDEVDFVVQLAAALEADNEASAGCICEADSGKSTCSLCSWNLCTIL
ncbi:ORF1A, partial [Fowl adenovirus 8a]